MSYNSTHNFKSTTYNLSTPQTLLGALKIPDLQFLFKLDKFIKVRI